MDTRLDKSFWNERYRMGDTGWDIGSASPAITEFVKEYIPKEARILIPGAGNAWEAEALFRAGYSDITVLDISEEPLQNLQKRVPDLPAEKLVCGDFFNHEGEYDLVLEQTFFCALEPRLRGEYARKMHELLAENGLLAGLWFAVEFEKEGPPFGGSLPEYERCFEPWFHCEEAAISQKSIKPRAGRELFMRWRRKIR
ncbi:MAG: methyltransferase domain-containing protein [Bacteroidia bacterium]|nr:methyltransferase domain-containing protein [Bacteroidia bacterium]